MALQVRYFIRNISYMLKTTKMFRDVARCDPVNIYKYKLILKNLKINKFDKVEDFINFQNIVFRSCPTDSLQSLISDSFDFVKEKKMVNNIETYNSILKSYLSNNINFDADNLSKEIRNNQIQFDQQTFSLLIEYYCNIGKMDNVEILLKEMNSCNEEVNLNSKLEIIKGYIIAGHPEKSKNYIIENNILENDPEIIISSLLGYSTLGQIDIVMEMIDKMKQDNLNLSVDNYFQFYLRLAQSNAPDSHLEKILLSMPNPEIDDIIKIILDLNRVELFNHSLRLLEKYNNQLRLATIIPDLLRSFNTKNCPIEIYKQALTILLQYKCDYVCSNIFAYMDYNDATIFANNLINETNIKHIAASLVNKAMNDKDMDKLEISLQFAKDKLKLKIFNMLLIYNYIPSMFENGLVSDCQELINLFPSLRNNILTVSFMYCLMKKDFQQINHLQTIYKQKNLFLDLKYHTLAKEILHIYKSMEDLNIFAMEFSKVFDRITVNNLLCEIIIKKIIYSSKVANTGTINDAINMTKNFDIMFRKLGLMELESKAKQHIELFKCLFDRIIPDKESNRET